MTREEAKTIFLNRGYIELDGGSYFDGNKWRESIVVISEWLKEEPCEDAVSREAVLEKINNIGVKGFIDYNSYSEMFDFVDALPPVTPKQRWIPVSERLPEEDGEYLLYGKVIEDEENNIFIGDYDSCAEAFGYWQNYYDPSTLGYVDGELNRYASVVAWMPLPEPWKGESE